MGDLLDINHVRVGERHRRDFGDLEALALSIKRLGLLHPIVVDADRKLLAGHRRLEACRNLGWPKVPVTVVRKVTDAVTALEAERDENTCRKDFTPTEAVALGLALEELERPKAAERMAEAGKRNLPTVSRGELPQLTAGRRTRDIVAPAVGMSGTTYDHAKAVVAAVDDPDPEVAEVAKNAAVEMDATGKVNGAYRKVLAAKKAPVIKKTREAIAARVIAISELAASGASSGQIASQIGIGRQAVKNLCAQHNIDVPADRALGRSRRIDADRVASETVITLEASAQAVGLIQVDQLDATRVAEWATSLSNSLRSLNRFAKQLKEMAHGQD